MSRKKSMGIVACLVVAAGVMTAANAAAGSSAAPAAVPVQARYSPLGATANGPSGPVTAKFAVAPFCCPSTAIELTPNSISTESDFQWLNLGLASDNTTVTTVTVCYSISTAVVGRTYISQTRVTDMTTPNAAVVRLDDATDRTAVGPACYDVGANFTPSGTMTLALKVVFGSTADRIRIGMVRLSGTSE